MNQPPEMPTAFPPSGVYGVTQLVTLLCATPGAEIRYTLDGSPPSPASPRFDPYRLIATVGAERPQEKSAQVIQAIAVKDGCASPAATFTYQIERRPREEYAWHEISPGLIKISDFEDDKMYLLTGSNRALLIDLGMGTGDLCGLVHGLMNGLPLDVVVTHGHPDHIAALGQFQPDCRVYLHPKDLPLALRSAGELDLSIDPSQFIPLYEGDSFDLGGRRLKVYELPGHTPGSITLLDEASGGLFSGDAVGSNRPAIVDALWLQESEAGVDVYLSALQVFRAKTAGRVKTIYTGHNDLPLDASAYLDHLEAAAQALVDQGLAALAPSPRPEGAWQVVSGDRFSDPNWAAINVRRETCLSVPPEQMATLSSLQVYGVLLNERFHPYATTYTAWVDDDVPWVRVLATATSSRCKEIAVNGVEIQSDAPCSVRLEDGENRIEVVVTSPDGNVQRMYALVITRY